MQAVTFLPLLSDDAVDFTPHELKLFAREIADMVLNGGKVDLSKAIHNAKFFAEIDRRLDNVNAGKNLVTFNLEDWNKFSENNF